MNKMLSKKQKNKMTNLEIDFIVDIFQIDAVDPVHLEPLEVTLHPGDRLGQNEDVGLVGRFSLSRLD
jgi:hypothetical protein